MRLIKKIVKWTLIILVAIIALSLFLTKDHDKKYYEVTGWYENNKTVINDSFKQLLIDNKCGIDNGKLNTKFIFEKELGVYYYVTVTGGTYNGQEVYAEGMAFQKYNDPEIVWFHVDYGSAWDVSKPKFKIEKEEYYKISKDYYDELFAIIWNK